MTKTQAERIQPHVENAIAALNLARGVTIADEADDDAELIGDSLDEALQAVLLTQERLNNVSGA